MTKLFLDLADRCDLPYLPPVDYDAAPMRLCPILSVYMWSSEYSMYTNMRMI